MKRSRKTIRTQSRTAQSAARRSPNESRTPSYRREIGAVVAIGIVAALGVVLWRGRDSLSQLRLPSPDALDRSARNAVRNSWETTKSALDRMPQFDTERDEVSRGLTALKQFFTRA